MKQHAFTLMEVMIAVGITAIVTAFAIPSMEVAIERGYERDTTDILRTIYFGEQFYALQNSDDFKAIPAGAWLDIQMDDPTTSFPQMSFVVVVNNTPPESFVATATRTGTGRYGGQTMTINQNQKLGGTYNP